MPPCIAFGRDDVASDNTNVFCRFLNFRVEVPKKALTSLVDHARIGGETFLPLLSYLILDIMCCNVCNLYDTHTKVEMGTCSSF